MMRPTIKIFTVLSLLLVNTPSWSADFKKCLTAYQNGNYVTALNECRPMAEQGNAFAQYTLGRMHDKGTGVPQDYKAAAGWYALAAEQGHADAQYNLGKRYFRGEGVLWNKATAHVWLNIAASNGNSFAARKRDIIAKLMNAEQIAAAQALALMCVESNYKNCPP